MLYIMLNPGFSPGKVEGAVGRRNKVPFSETCSGPPIRLGDCQYSFKTSREGFIIRPECYRIRVPF